MKGNHSKDGLKSSAGPIGLGLLFLYLAAVLNTRVLRAWNFNPEFTPAQRMKVHLFQGLLVLIALGLFYFRKHNIFKKSTLKIPSNLKAIIAICGVLFCMALALEAMTAVYFFRVMSEERRSKALFVAGVTLPGRAAPVPNFIPYLWSNYAPNPKSPHANTFGWRYGGGPKRARLRILCMGGSTTWEDLVDTGDKSYPAYLEKYLRAKGYDVDVVNGGVSYHASTETLGLFAYRGVYTNPDVVIFLTGENDIEPLLSPKPYLPDYSNWRTANFLEPNNNDFFQYLWKIPSWTSRLFWLMLLKPDGASRQGFGRQLTDTKDALTSTHSLKDRYPLGLENNLRSMYAITRAIGALPVAVTFRFHSDHPRSSVFSLTSGPDEAKKVIARIDEAAEMDNSVIRSVAKQMSVPIIPFEKFEASDPSYLADHCHLYEPGIKEKAAFFGRWLIDNNILKKALAAQK